MDAAVLCALLVAGKMKRRTKPVLSPVAATEGSIRLTLPPSPPAVLVAAGSSRNAKCSCGSGRKLKKCCGANNAAGEVRRNAVTSTGLLAVSESERKG
jgi:hypothetical protein